MKPTTLLLPIAMLLLVAFSSGCKKAEATAEDDTIIAETLAGNLLYYQGNNTTLAGAGNSPHGQFKLLFNQTAWAALDSTGKLPVGNTFPEGSLIVKEIIKNGSTDLYAVMLKKPSSSNAGAGWLWNEFEPNGDIVISISDKGDACISCHRGNTNRDLTNSFDLH